MFQSFEDKSQKEKGPERLLALRNEMATEGLDGFLVPRADRFQGEYVAPCDERLAWLTGFTGSAGFCAVTQEQAGVFVDGRYRVQARQQIAEVFSQIDWPDVKLADWLRETLPHGGKVGYDAWLHTPHEIEQHMHALEGSGIHLRPAPNLVDRIWLDRPNRPDAPIIDYPANLAGKPSCEKRADIAGQLRAAGQKAVVLTLPDSICWLLNIRGHDIARIPVAQCFAIVDQQGRVSLFTDTGKAASIGPDPDIDIADWDQFLPALSSLTGPVRVDKTSAPILVVQTLEAAGIETVFAQDPCVLPKARKNSVEIANTRAAHLRDGAALAEFLTWFEETAPKGALSEIDVVEKLEACRRATGQLKDISFDTIAGAGPHAAIVHYRVTHASNRQLRPGELLLLDSGGQYLDGTTDITRTLPVGSAPTEESIRRAYTRVLQGMIAISRARWPRGLAGRDLDTLARTPLWRDGLDYDHGTGHGVGMYLSVHEGPQRLSRTAEAPLEPGMIISNEPGYYREDAFGIRIENLLIVQQAQKPDGGDEREMLQFETLTWVPIDKRLILKELLSADESGWLNTYHAGVYQKIAPLVGDKAKNWLKVTCAPL